MNDKEYKYYVILPDGKIESGWEYKEDAEDQKENLPDKFIKTAKIIKLKGLKTKNIDPDNDKNWAGNIMKEDIFDNLYESIINEWYMKKGRDVSEEDIKEVVAKTDKDKKLSEEDIAKFVTFIKERFAGESVTKNYIGEWVGRIIKGNAWGYADSFARKILKKTGLVDQK